MLVVGVMVIGCALVLAIDLLTEPDVQADGGVTGLSVAVMFVAALMFARDTLGRTARS